MSNNEHGALVLSSTESRALQLLGSGLDGVTVARATGVSESRISQLLSDAGFATQVAELRFTRLQRHTERDDKLDSMEDKIIKQLDNLLPMIYEPMKLLKALQVINGAKRRGASAPLESQNQSSIVNVILPRVIVQNFTTNINNQVIKTGNQDLLTVQSSAMKDMVGKIIDNPVPVLENTP